MPLWQDFILWKHEFGGRGPTLPPGLAASYFAGMILLAEAHSGNGGVELA